MPAFQREASVRKSSSLTCARRSVCIMGRHDDHGKHLIVHTWRDAHDASRMLEFAQVRV